jgi:hypothetical protein
VLHRDGQLISLVSASQNVSLIQWYHTQRLELLLGVGPSFGWTLVNGISNQLQT